MMCAVRDLPAQNAVRVRFVCAPDEESEDIDRALHRRRGRARLHAATSPSRASRPTSTSGAGQGRVHLRLARARPRRPRLDAVAGRQRGLEGDRRVPANRVLAVRARVVGDVRPALDQPRADPRRRALNKVPDQCTMVVDIRYLPDQDPGEILEQIRAIPDVEVVRTFIARARATCSRAQPVRAGAVRRRAARLTSGEAMSVGRDGASDAISFLAGRRSRRSSSARSAPGTTARRSGSRSPRWRATGGARGLRAPACRTRSRPASGLRAVDGGLA